MASTCAEDYGVLMANRNAPGSWETFRVVERPSAELGQTRIEVNVYKIGGAAPLWHTGTVIEGREYFFTTTNRVESIDVKTEKMKAMSHHRTLVRIVPGNGERVRKIRDQVLARWNGTRYDFGAHNCNLFTDDLLQSLGVPGLDQEYLNASGLAKGLRQVSGGATAQELLVKWPVDDKRLDKAFMDDLSRLGRLPEDTAEELKRFGGTISEETRRAVATATGAAKEAGGKLSQGAKDAGGKIADTIKKPFRH
jgi:hypothetical protein